MSDRAMIFAIAGIFTLVQNRYFGWNWSPQSDAELIADGMCLLMFCIAFTVKA